MNDPLYQSKRRRGSRRSSRFGWRIALTIVTMALLVLAAMIVPLILRAS